MGEQAAKSGFINKIFHSLAVVMACPGMTFPSQFSLMVALTPSEGCVHTLFQPGSFSVPEVKTFLRWQMAWKVCFKRCLITVCIYSPHCKCWSPGKQAQGECWERERRLLHRQEKELSLGVPPAWSSGGWLIFCKLGRLLFWNAGVCCIRPCNSQRRVSHLQ